MKSQKSFSGEQTTLYLVATPIGNLEDMTVRALRLLKEVDVIAAEDTRNTKKLCNYFSIDTPLVSYHEHNQDSGGEKILRYLGEGKSVALVSDAGMPCISDPGEDIVKKAVEAGYPVVPVPGANAALSALIASGITPQPFLFYGFLSRNKKARLTELEKLSQKEETLLFYEAPHRLKDSLKSLMAVFGGDRRIVLAREVTKKFEEFLRGSLEEAVAWSESNEIRGEFCLVVEGNLEPDVLEVNEWWKELTYAQHVTQLMEQKQISSKEAIKEAAKARGLPKRDVYEAFHKD
ncbi:MULTISPECIES: 16S rRNA (cytidine(1402)-2'-O)-methyltransferase [unclassified Planococcus (in: firmicutes)]|uniref:16S rRNA (cytidine(1402)-2'-O)-methyltransferase n=1 Tax=unclassified Planococcus (in: firmicutes) TaxID=2662419 RepID=UPI000C34D00D|nr:MULTISPECIES: 16S rRNA (cytidine(1402)-2'-O)-methyltransferase [unclassified Planococcus (in: firmicutes)]AUD12543.1 16S rRNA (cytidine(1402)-2'-O)-methyltransferase [Planococcus sp. MB-3u-03]PKG44438.1 16S rRNA (cytidine(1402)-2'-O)-methyltransferase [Planococcus sp. Urea-trap-24]PKG91251.1 16S rRNA (cytidine(1402)-2'-O)-methyltransferase [Planococcus sp. Urea-3u-39]PKH39590.1 16S rRNA (cytidine(1402)-2'-O)-methyltransferase [Planococcus sp. MB-3u-09]